MKNPVKQGSGGSRKVKSHKKSRHGCSGCKLRCVKCDETKPQCKRCLDFGTICSYVSGNLQTKLERVVGIVDLPYWPSKAEETFDKFKTQTAQTISAGPLLTLYQNKLVQVAQTNPHLKYALLVITSMHDKRLNGFPEHKLSALEAQQWYRASHCFRKQLFVPSTSLDTIASLVATSAILFQATFNHIEAEDPSDAWPLCDPSVSDLSWLKLTNGKKEVLKLAQPLLRDEMYKHMILGPDPSSMIPVRYESGLPYELVCLWHLETPAEANPYYKPAATLTNGLYSNDIMQLLFSFLNFISNIDAGFEQLLSLKDPAALLLLGCWFSIIARTPIWWLQRRARLEGEAIRQYLSRYHKMIDPDRLIRLGSTPLYLPGLGTA